MDINSIVLGHPCNGCLTQKVNHTILLLIKAQEDMHLLIDNQSFSYCMSEGSPKGFPNSIINETNPMICNDPSMHAFPCGSNSNL